MRLPQNQKRVRALISKKLEKLRRVFQLTQGIQWIRYMRKTLNMTLQQLSVRTGIAYSNISRLEKAEKAGNLNLKTLKTLAAGLECEFVYAFVPKKKLEKIIDEQAQKVAEQILARSSINMELEDQSVHDVAIRNQILEIKEHIQYSNKLWNDYG